MSTANPAAVDITAAVKKTLTSAAFSKFIEQAVHTAASALQAVPGAVVLHGQPLSKPLFGHHGNYSFYRCKSADGLCDICLQTSYVENDQAYRGKWYGSETRTDEQGRTWSRSIDFMVHDDFGFLVEVPK